MYPIKGQLVVCLIYCKAGRYFAKYVGNKPVMFKATVGHFIGWTAIKPDDMAFVNLSTLEVVLLGEYIIE